MVEEKVEKMAKAVIVGGSIAGISTAHALILAGWDVLVLEKTTSPPSGTPTGAGLGLNPLSQQIIQSWLPHPQLLHNTTLPLTIDQVQPTTLYGFSFSLISVFPFVMLSLVRVDFLINFSCHSATLFDVSKVLFLIIMVYE